MRAIVIKRVNYILMVNYLEYSYIINIQFIIPKAEFAGFVGTDKAMEWKLCNNMLTSNSLQREKPSRVVSIVHALLHPVYIRSYHSLQPNNIVVAPRNFAV